MPPLLCKGISPYINIWFIFIFIFFDVKCFVGLKKGEREEGLTGGATEGIPQSRYHIAGAHRGWSSLTWRLLSPGHALHITCKRRCPILALAVQTKLQSTSLRRASFFHHSGGGAPFGDPILPRRFVHLMGSAHTGWAAR